MRIYLPDYGFRHQIAIQVAAAPPSYQVCSWDRCSHSHLKGLHSWPRPSQSGEQAGNYGGLAAELRSPAAEPVQVGLSFSSLPLLASFGFVPVFLYPGINRERASMSRSSLRGCGFERGASMISLARACNIGNLRVGRTSMTVRLSSRTAELMGSLGMNATRRSSAPGQISPHLLSLPPQLARVADHPARGVFKRSRPCRFGFRHKAHVPPE